MCLLILVRCLSAQDLITTKYGTIIKSKIIETTPTEIKYKNYYDLEGTTYTLNRKEVISFKYEEKTTTDKTNTEPTNKIIEKEETKPSQTNSNTSIDVSNFQDVVYLKNGSIIRGTIIDQQFNKSIKIQTADKNIFSYQMEEVDKITKVPSSPTAEKILEQTTQGNENYSIVNITRNSSPHEWNQKTSRFALMVYVNDKPVCELPYKSKISIKVFFIGEIKLCVKFISTNSKNQIEIDKYYFSGNPLSLDVISGKTYNAKIEIEEENGFTLNATAKIVLIQ